MKMTAAAYTATKTVDTNGQVLSTTERNARICLIFAPTTNGVDDMVISPDNVTWFAVPLGGYFQLPTLPGGQHYNLANWYFKGTLAQTLGVMYV